MSKEVHEIVGEYILQKRLEQKLNSTQFAKKVGLARSTVFNIEKKVGSCISLSSMNAILTALDIPWSELAEILDKNNGEKYDRYSETGL